VSAVALPKAATLVPHQGDTVLLDAVTRIGADRCEAQVVVRPRTAFSDPAGNLPAWVGPEIMAQAISALAGHRSLLERGKPASIGLLLGVRNYRCTAGEFRCGDVLRVEVVESSVDAQGWAVFDGSISREGAIVATGTLTVLQPPDDAFLDAECARHD